MTFRKFIPAWCLAILCVTTASAQDRGVVADYRPISGAQRLTWLANSPVGPTSLLIAGPISAAWGTAFNKPEEYGPGWEGFGQRYGMRLTGVATGNAIEAGLGSIWKEDPRYFRSRNLQFGGRIKYVLRTTFESPDENGHLRPAYARFAGNVGNNFLSNTWRVDSENGAGDAALRCLWGVLGKIGSNAFAEFWPDVKKKVFKK